MVGGADKDKIIFFIKDYYEKNNETPSMKVICEKCRINSRAFYELFKSQKEAFEIAGVPYSDEKRKKVEPANVARRIPPAIQVVSEKETLYVVDGNRLDGYRSRNISDPFDELRYDAAINKTKFIKSNPQDEIHIEEAYDAVNNFIDSVSSEFMQLVYWYQWCKKLKNAPPGADKVFLVNKGFDFNDIDGSHKKLREKAFSDNRLYYEPKFNLKARDYYDAFMGPLTN
jgi:hypothetical protein